MCAQIGSTGPPVTIFAWRAASDFVQDIAPNSINQTSRRVGYRPLNTRLPARVSGSDPDRDNQRARGVSRYVYGLIIFSRVTHFPDPFCYEPVREPVALFAFIFRFLKIMNVNRSAFETGLVL